MFILRVDDANFAQGYGYAYRGKGWALTGDTNWWVFKKFATAEEAETVAKKHFAGRKAVVEQVPG